MGLDYLAQKSWSGDLGSPIMFKFDSSLPVLCSSTLVAFEAKGCLQSSTDQASLHELSTEHHVWYCCYNNLFSSLFYSNQWLPTTFQQFTNQSLQPQLSRCQAMRGQTHTEQGLKIPNIKLMTHSGQIIPPAEKPPNRQHIQFFTPLPRC